MGYVDIHSHVLYGLDEGRRRARSAHDVQFRSPSLFEAYTMLADEWERI
jgi:tyrosine-protein phosphatase YwqE